MCYIVIIQRAVFLLNCLEYSQQRLQARFFVIVCSAQYFDK